MRIFNLISTAAIATVLCSGIAPVGNAQQAPGGMGMQPQMGPMSMPQMMPTITKVGVKGVFTLTGSTLSKLNLITLTKVASVELIQIPPTTQPSGMGGMPMMMVMQPANAVMALSSDRTLVVIGNLFFSVDASTMKIVGKATLPIPAVSPGMPGMMPDMQNMPMMPGMMGPGGSMPGNPNQQMPNMMPGMQGDQNQQMPGMMPGMQPQPQQQQMMMSMMMIRQGMQMPSPQTTIEVVGTTAYIINGSTVIAVNINNGKITGTNLPTAPKPPAKR